MTTLSSCSRRTCFTTSLLTILFMLAGLQGASLDARAQPAQSVDSIVQVSYTGFVLDRATNTFGTQATIGNISRSTIISGPISLVLTSLGPAGVTLANATGITANGNPMVSVPVPAGGLAPGAKITNVVLKFNNPARARIAFTSSVLGMLPGPSNVTVPNVVGLTQAAATTAITGANLTVGTVTQQNSNTVGSGRVISQTPNANASVAPSSAVNLTVSIGPANVNVPNVVGLTQAAATTAITGANLTLGTVTQQNSNTVASGNVISQTPNANASVAPSSAVNLTVSIGPANVNVPNVVGLTQAAATTAITGANLTVGTVTQQNSNTVASGNVISQTPNANASVAPSSAVNLTVSLGPANVNVPNVVGLTQAAATTAITGANLTVGTVTQQNSNTVASGNVISQTPNANASVAPSSAVNLTVSIGPANVTVPNVVGLTQAAATTAITGANLTLGTVTQQNSNTVASGNVISQTPNANASVAPNSAVNLTVSIGPANVTVPNVVGLTQAAATTAITGANLTVGTVTQQNSNTVASGNVISQTPNANASVAPNSAVNLTVSIGPANVTVPNVVGLTQAAATTAITGANLTVGTVTQQNSNTVASGSVISQTPSANASVAPNSAVNLTVSIGPANVTVPNVVGLTQAAATTAITGANLTLGTVTQQNSNTVASGNVISQTPNANASVAPSSAVNLTVSIGPANVTVPNVVGLTQAAATTAITGANLTVGTLTVQNSNTVPSGSVISQSPNANASVAPGTAVNLFVSGGPSSTPTPASLKLSLPQLVIGAGSSLGITPQVMDNGGNPITPTPGVSYQILFNQNTARGSVPAVTGDQIGTAADTRGSFTLKGTVTGTNVTSQIVFNVIQNATQSANSGLYVKLAAAQGSLVQNLATITAALQSGNTGAIPAASAALAAAATSVDIQALSLGSAYEPDTGFVPTASQLSSRGFPPGAGDTNFATLTSQVRTKLQQIKQLLNQPTGNDAVDAATLAQYATELDTLWNQLQLAANRPSVNGLSNHASIVNSLLSNDIPTAMLAIISRVRTQLQQAGLAAVGADPGSLYGMVESDLQAPFTRGLQPHEMYESVRPAFGLTGLLGSAGPIGQLIQKIYGDYLDQIQKMYLLLGVQQALNQFLNPTAQVAGLITGASQSFHIYHGFDSKIEVTGLSLGEAQAADVFLIGGAAVNAVTAAIKQLGDIRNIRSLRDLYNFFQGVLDTLHNLGKTYDDAHQQPNFAVQTGFDEAGCLSSLADSCVELHYNNGFNYVGSGGPVKIEPVIILVKTTSVHNPQFGSNIFNFVGQ